MAIQADRVLLLDTYFMVVVFYGATVAEWRRAKYHEQPEHQAFRSGMISARRFGCRYAAHPAQQLCGLSSTVSPFARLTSGPVACGMVSRLC